jgi:hypothetical protein
MTKKIELTDSYEKIVKSEKNSLNSGEENNTHNAKSNVTKTKKNDKNSSRFITLSQSQKKILAWILASILVINFLLFAFVILDALIFWLIILACYMTYKLTFKN